MTSENVAESVRNAMRRTAAGVTILATDGPAGREGVTISTLCSLSLEPPSVIACVHKDSRAIGPLLDNGVFSANILGQGQSEVAEAFAGMLPQYKENRFSAGHWYVDNDVPRLANSVASFACRLVDRHAFGTHLILIGEIIAVTETPGEPLLYADRGFRQLAAA